jgi:hypothetical protein
MLSIDSKPAYEPRIVFEDSMRGIVITELTHVGEEIYEEDTGLTYVYDGYRWNKKETDNTTKELRY